MAKPVTRTPLPANAERQLDAMVDRFLPAVAKVARRAIAKMRRLAPGAVELVYDNYNALAIGFAPGERPSEGIFSVALYPPHASLFFLQGAKLPDPTKRLKGRGNVVRHIVLDTADELDAPDVRRLIRLALQRAKVPLPAGQKRKMIIKAISEKQRPRRPKGTGRPAALGEIRHGARRRPVSRFRRSVPSGDIRHEAQTPSPDILDRRRCLRCGLRKL
jgi:hypothetical protein